MQNNDSTSAFYQAYNRNTVPTDFEYVGFPPSLNTTAGRWMWKLHTYSYNNAQYYAHDNPN